METITLKPERKAQLEDYAQRHGQDPAVALDEEAEPGSISIPERLSSN